MFQDKEQAFNLLLFGIVLFSLIIFNFNYRTPLFLGFIIATLTYPIFTRFLDRLRSVRQKWLALLMHKYAVQLSAILTIVFISTILTVSANIFFGQLISDIRLGSFQDWIKTTVDLVVNNSFLQDIFGDEILTSLGKEISQQVNTLSQQLSDENERSKLIQTLFSSGAATGAISQALSVGQRTFDILFDFSIHFIVFLLAWFFGLVNGEDWLKHVFRLLPLAESEKEQIKEDLNKGIRNVIYANLLSGFIHTLCVALIMLVFGLPNIFIVSSITFIIGVLPLSPSELGYLIPIVLIWQMNPFLALAIFCIAEMLILFVNYVLTPKVIVSDEDGNPLLILTSILSGLWMFGLMGFIISPVIMILIQTLYRILIKRQFSKDKTSLQES